MNKLLEQNGKHGVRVDMVPLPFDKFTAKGAQAPDYMLCICSEGDRQIDQICDMIRIVSKAGIPAIKYFLCESPNQRTEQVPLGRGGLRYSTWDLEKALAKNPAPYKVPVSLDENWERITYFLERVIPVATEYKVRMACHPCDPWLPPGYRGITRALSNFEGFKKFIEICPSPYHGLNLCLGCMAESVEDPAKEVPNIIRYFGKRKKIFLIHFRNIIGKVNKFQEVFQDEGVMNMWEIMRTMKEVDYPYMFVEDHAPTHPLDPGARQSRAFQWGYMIAMLQAVNGEI
jgi:mannonate dehydratase